MLQCDEHDAHALVRTVQTCWHMGCRADVSGNAGMQTLFGSKEQLYKQRSKRL